MFKYYNALLNRSGDALAGYFVRLFDSSGNQVTIYADENETAISTESGVANAAKSDLDGMVRFFVPSGDYDIRLYDPNDNFISTERAVPMVKGISELALEGDDGATKVGTSESVTVQAALDSRAKVSDLASTDSDKGAALVAWKRGASSYAVARTLSDKAADTISILDFSGADNTGATDCSTALNNAITELSASGGGVIFIPVGEYLFESSIELRRDVYILGSGRGGSTFVSGIIGGSLFKMHSSGASFFGVSGLKLEGNGLTGASGNGNAIDMIDPDINSGTHYPQQAIFHDLYITGFKGTGRFDNSTGTAEACGVIQIDGLAVEYSHVVITDCGHGFYFRLTQNTRITNCIVEGALKYACCLYDNENTVIRDNDFINSGDGVAAVAFPVAGALSAILWSRQNEGLLVVGNKFKNTSGKALIVSEFGNGDVYSGNWLQATMMADVDHKAMYHLRPSHVVIRDNYFSPVATTYTNGGKKYQQVEIDNNSATLICSAVIEGNTFENLSNGTIDYNIRIGGNASSRKFRGVAIRGNRFGLNNAVSAACTVDRDIFVNNCDLSYCDISYNTSIAVANVTRTALLAYTSVSGNTANQIFGNSGTAASGTITAVYSGVTPQQAYTASTVSTVSAQNTNLAPAHNGNYVRFTYSGAKTLTVQDDATEPLPANGEWHIRNASASGNLTLVEDTSVTINPPVGGTLEIEPGGTVTLKRVGTDEFDLMGVTVPA